jgi:hypothetical protein
METERKIRRGRKAEKVTVEFEVSTAVILKRCHVIS